MNMVEVDPVLFIKCRLCLDETGQYQIVPNVQMQIKYCFDIDIAPFDGLPQLVCRKCESILSQYAGMKQIFQEKQKNLKSKLNTNVKTDNIVQQQQDTVSSTQADTETNKNKLETPSTSSKTNRTTAISKRHSSTETVNSNCSQRKSKKHTQADRTWQISYNKQIVCRYCNKTFKDNKAIQTHIKKNCILYTKYSYINKSFCLVALNKIGSKSNITGTKDNVVCNKSKVIQSKNANYYIVYTNKSNNQQEISESSDDDIFIDKRKRKRRRLISRSSNETVVIEQNIYDKKSTARKPEWDNTPNSSDIECVNIEDSDSNSTRSTEKRPEKTKTFSDKMLNNVITMCYNKYINRLNTLDGENSAQGKDDSSLKHKILSVGRKVICGGGINTIGLLRYMEHKNLEILWVPANDTRIVIKTRTKEKSESGISDHGWENISSLSNYNNAALDFDVVFEKSSVVENHLNAEKTQNSVKAHTTPQLLQNDTKDNTERKQKENAIIYFSNLKQLDKQSTNSDTLPENVSTHVGALETKVGEVRNILDLDKNWTKLLNANPVANPKQLPKKNNFNEPATLKLIEQTNKDRGDDLLHMPIITSTVSLALPEPTKLGTNQNANELKNDNSKSQAILPKIKVKPVSELMYDKASTQQSTTFISTSGWTVIDEGQNQNVRVQTNGNNSVSIGTPISNLIYLTENQDLEAAGSNTSSSRQKSATKQATQKQHFVQLHTVELPNTKTDMPYRYVQRLLQIHNLLLLNSVHKISSTMQSLSKLRVVFNQDITGPVTLCVVLYCENNIFCIKASDQFQNELDIEKFTANWQWELLKVFRDDGIVSKSLESAMRFSSCMLNYTTCFINLLKSIIYSNDT